MTRLSWYLNISIIVPLLLLTPGLASGENDTPQTPDSCPGVNRALVLEGGGVRGAYQAGALWYLVKVLRCDFMHFIGTSTGAVSAAFLSQAATAELPRYVDDLIQDYLDLRDRGDLVRKRFLGKIRTFVSPAWPWSLDGIHSLDPLSERLARRLDEERLTQDRLTVVALSLQSGPMRAGYYRRFRPTSWKEYVVGSASIPGYVEPKVTRLWVSGFMRITDEEVDFGHSVVGLPDPDCLLRIYPWVIGNIFPDARLDENVVLPCRQIGTSVPGGTPQTPELWNTKLKIRLHDLPEDQRARLDFRLKGGGSLYGEFTTKHQIVDGGLTDHLPIRQALDVAGTPGNPRQPPIVYDTLFMLSTGWLQSPPIKEYRGGEAIVDRSFEYLWEEFTIRSHRFFQMTLEKFQSPPRIHYITPGPTVFESSFDVSPAKIRQAIWLGCARAVERIAAVHRRVPDATKCAPLIPREAALSGRDMNHRDARAELPE